MSFHSKSLFFIALALCTSLGYTDNVYVDLSNLFDRDAFVSGGAGQGDPLDDDGCWLDAASLPADYTDGTAYATVDGLTEFLYGNLTGSESDSLRINGQSLVVPAGNYRRLQLSLLSTAGFLDLGRKLTLHYADGTSDETVLGPLANWEDSPLRYFDRYYNWTDSSEVNEVVSLQLQQNDTDYIYEMNGSPNEARDDYRFVDGSGYLIYMFDLEDDLRALTMGVDMCNNFIVGISTDFGETYTDVLNSQEMFGTDVHDGTNRRVYEVNLAPYLGAFPDNTILVRFTDGTTNDGWGPSIWDITLFTGTTKTYEGEVATPIDTTQATVYADFRADGSEAEAAYLIENNNSNLTSGKHRFADNSNSFVYGFDLPDDATDAKAALNIEGDFVVSVATVNNLSTPIDFVPGGERDADYIFEDSGSSNPGSYRFCDGGNYIIYMFELPSDMTQATLKIDMENNFITSVGSDYDPMDVVLNSQELYGEDIHNGSNRQVYTVSLDSYLANNPDKYIFVKFEDGSTSDGWGPAIYKISIVSGEEAEYTTVYSSDEAYADAIVPYNKATTSNKGFFTLDLSSFLENNSAKKLYVKFTDASTDNGWGPGLFRFILFGGDITMRPDGLCMKGLDTTLSPTDIYPWGINLTRREFAVDSSKTLQSVTLPALADSQDIYLFAATLEGGATAVSEWNLF